MGKFTNLEIHTEPETTLFHQESNLILAVIDQVLSSFDTYPTQGTFILDGQKRGEDAKCLIRFNLEDGVCPPIAGFDDTSDDIATNAINAVLSWPAASAYGYKGEPNLFGQFSSGIYQHGRKKVLVLNATFGRFLMSYYADSGCSNCRAEAHDDGNALLLSVAETIAQMGKEDKILQKSVDSITNTTAKNEQDAITLVERLFLEGTFPPLQVWKEWHEPANTSGALTLFFE